MGSVLIASVSKGEESESMEGRTDTEKKGRKEA